jgi:hypothetical protein
MKNQTIGILNPVKTNLLSTKDTPVEFGYEFCWKEESEEGLTIDAGFLGCDVMCDRNNFPKNSMTSHRAQEWSDGPEKGIVMPGGSGAIRKFIKVAVLIFVLMLTDSK